MISSYVASLEKGPKGQVYPPVRDPRHPILIFILKLRIKTGCCARTEGCCASLRVIYLFFYKIKLK